jgi:hypothetical protein
MDANTRRTPCICCGQRGHLRRQCSKRLSKLRGRDFDHQLTVDTNSDPEERWRRRRQRKEMFTPKAFSKLKTRNVESFFHLPLGSNVVQVSDTDPLVVPLLLKKRVKGVSWDANREFTIDSVTIDSLTWKESAIAMTGAIEAMKHDKWSKDKSEALRKKKSLFATLNDQDHVLLGSSCEHLNEIIKRRKKEWKTGSRERLGPSKKDSYAALADSNIKFPISIHAFRRASSLRTNRRRRPVTVSSM